MKKLKYNKGLFTTKHTHAHCRDMSFNRRTLKEIKAGYESSEFDFFQDIEGEYGDAGACYLRFTIQDGIYEGETHVLQMKFVYGEYVYPKNAPNVLFMTPIYHTNIATGGSICLDVIKSNKWSPFYGIETIFNSIIALLGDPNTNSPFNGGASRSYTDHVKTKSLDKYSEICHAHYQKNLGKADSITNRLLNAPEFFSETDDT
jgi:ubiquitin-protein ligase